MTSKEALYQLNEIALGSKSVKENNWYYREIIQNDLEVFEFLKSKFDFIVGKHGSIRNCFYTLEIFVKNDDEIDNNIYINLSKEEYDNLKKLVK